jgi:hypothetical protein
VSEGTQGRSKSSIPRAWRAVSSVFRALPGLVQGLAAIAGAVVVIVSSVIALRHLTSPNVSSVSGLSSVSSTAKAVAAKDSPTRSARSDGSPTGSISAPAKSSSSTPSEASADPYLAQLERHLPAVVTGLCRSVQIPPGALASVVCTQGSGVDKAYFLLFDSRAAMDDQMLHDSVGGLQSGDCDPTVPPSDSSSAPAGAVSAPTDAAPREHTSYTTYGVNAGTVECFPGPGGAEIEWTNNDLLIWGLVVRADKLYTPVFNWWEDNSLR